MSGFVSYKWCYLVSSPDERWIDFDNRTSDKIEQAFLSKNHVITEQITSIDFRNAVVSINNAGPRKLLPLKRESMTKAREYLWEWFDGEFWVEYSLSDMEYISMGQNIGLDFVTVHVGKPFISFRIDFSNMTQTGVASRYSRPIRKEYNPAYANHTALSTISTTSTVSDITNTLLVKVLSDALVGTAGEDEECVICLDKFSTKDEQSLRLNKCGPHFFHRNCIHSALNISGKCPYCSERYLCCEGTQPKEGKMTYTLHPPGTILLEGFPPTIGTIVIKYTFSNGIQGPEHPNPGSPYRGTIRHAYLPDNAEGRELLMLLRRCFDQRLTFTVGQSITTGLDNCVVWNGIHHKVRY